MDPKRVDPPLTLNLDLAGYLDRREKELQKGQDHIKTVLTQDITTLRTEWTLEHKALLDQIAQAEKIKGIEKQALDTRFALYEVSLSAIDKRIEDKIRASQATLIAIFLVLLSVAGAIVGTLITRGK